MCVWFLQPVRLGRRGLHFAQNRFFRDLLDSLMFREGFPSLSLIHLCLNVLVRFSILLVFAAAVIFSKFSPFLKKFLIENRCIFNIYWLVCQFLALLIIFKSKFRAYFSKQSPKTTIFAAESLAAFAFREVRSLESHCSVVNGRTWSVYPIRSRTPIYDRFAALGWRNRKKNSPILFRFSGRREIASNGRKTLWALRRALFFSLGNWRRI